ncbi:MAG TPA: aldehyde dehydrogenase family protein [Pseudogracilibacillus sp.]|nr:aldehyde dehydrogenase family protein [Pseudogracilibacillus sp.]
MNNNLGIKEWGMFINGNWSFPKDRSTFDVENPYTDECIGTLPIANIDDVNEATSSAEDHFNDDLLSLNDRYNILLDISKSIERDADLLSDILVQEVGKTKTEASGEVKSAIDAFVLAAEEAKRITGNEIPMSNKITDEKSKYAVTMKVPSGPICAITAFNAPLNQGAHKIAAAIAAGCTVVLKPSPFTPFHAIHLVNIMIEAGLPKGHIQLLFGGVEVGDALLESQKFSRYMFTGSLNVGKQIAVKAGLRPVILEMGSNAPNIVHKDADIDVAVQSCLSGFALAGQVCTSVHRLFVHEDIYQEFSDKFIEKIKGLKVGDPMNSDTDIGPVRNDQSSYKFDKLIKEATDGGATILHGGNRDGRLISPTILSNLEKDMKVYFDETFLPIINLIPYKDFDAIIKESNDSIYGLQAGVFTSNLHLAFKAARELKVGGVMINDASRYRVAQMPFGGVKGSGVGREGLPYAIELLSDLKNVVFTSNNF